MKIVAVIPCRFGSTRFEGKPLATIAGKAMIRRVYERVSRSTQIDSVVVATDSQRILDAVREFGGQALLTSATLQSGTDRAAEAGSLLDLSDPDLVVNVQGDQPLVDPRALDEVVEPLIAEPGLGMSTLAFRIIDEREYNNPKDVKVTFDDKGNALYFSRAPIPFARDAGEIFDSYKHLGIYAYTYSFLKIFSKLPPGRLERIEKLEQLRALENGYPVRVVISAYDSPEVDLPEDIGCIERLLALDD